ncbi:flagellar hook-basal body protein [Pullulanibacillus sp. KACC 23026]|uniref:flagellar hook-basal body protein n=1 Tax=Pullulanibacillus sp. KACC 23026 TaxID=3028315 RepID=UPI0023AE6C9E|nr:flagellar hook-basal body protein [Pullulanibacillus sp. KACC 23026]WEG11257.1 flagellar hook-basal body protein [Pullulanibacillus sp. KACC 23026]
MLRGLDTASSGMIALERRQETLADNLANVQTPGYKKDDAVMRAFPKLLMSRIQDYNDQASGTSSTALPGQQVPIGSMYNGVYVQERIPNFSEGDLVQTGEPLDVAIEDQNIPTQTVNGNQVKPDAFFAVQLPDGTVGYTRDGKWDLDANGNLVTADGYKVLGADHKPIQITGSIDKSNMQINKDGQILLNANDPAQMKTAGQVGIALVQNPDDLQRLGGNVYQATNPQPFIQDGGGTNPGVTLNQGYLEQSNVDEGQTMTDMMTTVRGYEANQKVISAYDSSLQQLYTVAKLDG